MRSEQERGDRVWLLQLREQRFSSLHPDEFHDTRAQSRSSFVFSLLLCTTAIHMGHWDPAWCPRIRGLAACEAGPRTKAPDTREINETQKSQETKNMPLARKYREESSEFQISPPSFWPGVRIRNGHGFSRKTKTATLDKRNGDAHVVGEIKPKTREKCEVRKNQPIENEPRHQEVQQCVACHLALPQEGESRNMLQKQQQQQGEYQHLKWGAQRWAALNLW